MINKEELKRKHTIQINLNTIEYEALCNYCKQHQVDNRAKFIRQVVMREIMHTLAYEGPSLFPLQ